MKAKKILKIVLALALASVMLFAVACRSNTGTTDPTNAPATNAPATNTPATNAPATEDPMAHINRDGILVFGGSGWDGKFNSIMSNNIYDRMVGTLVFEGLLSNNAAGEPIPNVATHWEVSNESRTYTFHIDPRAKFSDGSPLTAHDVSFTYHTIASPLYDGPRTNAVQDLVGFEAYNDGEADSVEGIRVINDHTIEFTNTMASPQHIWNFGYGILSRNYYAFGDNWDTFLSKIDKPFGSGQYIFVDYVFQQWIEFERNENYWNTDKQVNLAGVIMREVSTESIVPALIAGEIHIGMARANADDKALLEEADNVRTNLFVANTLRHITFNTQRFVLEDHRVRQALAYAFDTKAYIVADTNSPDLMAVGNSPFSPVSWAFPGVDALNNYDFDMDKAHALMDEAGWLMGPDNFRYKDGQKMKLHWLIYHEAAWPGIVTGMAAHTWGELGVELDIEMMDFATVNTYTNALPIGEKQFDVYQMGWSMAIDPDLRGGLWDAANDQAGGFFNSGFYNDRLMELIELGATTMDQATRTKIYHEIAEITNEYLPVWVLSNGTNLWGINTKVNNLNNGAFMDWDLSIVQQGTWLE